VSTAFAIEIFKVMWRQYEVRPRWSLDRYGRRASLRLFRTAGPLPAKVFAAVSDDGTFELIVFPPSGGGDFQPRRNTRPTWPMEQRGGIARFLLLVLVEFHLPAP
jgi:hypothetical protein